MVNSQDSQPKGSMLWSMLHIFRFLIRKRWYYLLLGAVASTAFYLYIKNRLPMPTREYFTTYRVRYSDPKLQNNLVEQEKFHPDWAMNNPFTRDMAIKYFESTRMVIEAGERLNYSVNYRVGKRDIYDSIPVDVRFVSPRDQFDEWSMTLRPGKDGVLLEGIKGVYQKKPVRPSSVFVPYDQEVATPVGSVLAKRTEMPLKYFPKISLTKMSDVDTQERYDRHMMRHMGSNLIELFLTANCTEQFAEDFFDEIEQAYVRYAQEHYKRNLIDYTNRLNRAITQVRSGEYQAESIDLRGLNVSESTRNAMLAELETLAERARANALILEQSDMIERLDPVLIRSVKQSAKAEAFVYILAIIILMAVPALAITAELALSRRIVNPDFLKSLMPSAVMLGSIHDSRDKSRAAGLIALKAEYQLGKSEIKHLVVTETTQGQGADELLGLFKQSAAQSQALALDVEVVQAPSLAESNQALLALRRAGTALLLVVRSGCASIEQIKALNEHCQSVGVPILIVWNNALK